MARRLLAPALLMLLLVASRQDPVAPPPSQVLVVKVDGEVGVRTVSMVQSTLREARATGAQKVVLDIDTPGGELVATREVEALIQALGGQDVQVVAFVRRHAWSAGAYIALACHQLYMAAGASIGAITPVVSGPGGLQQIPDDDVRRKGVAALRAELRALVERRGLPASCGLAAEAMVDPAIRLFEVVYNDAAGVQTNSLMDEEMIRELEASGARIQSRLPFGTQPLALTAQEAERFGFSAGTINSIEELVRDEMLLPTESIAFRDETWSESAVSWLDGMKPVLFLLGFLLLSIEVKAPGFALPGVLGLLLLGLAMFGSYLVGLAEWTEILLFFAGIAMIAVEVFVLPGMFVFGLLGFLCLVSGLVLSQQSFFLPQSDVQRDILTGNLNAILLLTVLTIVSAVAFGKLIPHIPVLNRILQAPPETPATGASTRFAGDQGLANARQQWLGRIALATSDLRPAGVVDLDGQRLDVVSAGGYVDRGTKIRITEVSANRIVVEPVLPDSAGQVSVSLLILIWTVGLCFVIAEVFFPSFGLLSVLAAISFVTSIFLAYTHHGMALGHTFLGLAAVAVPAVVAMALRILPKTSIGRALLLSGPDPATVKGAAAAPGLERLAGKRGQAETVLRPAGFARLEGQRVDVVTTGEMLDAGTPVRVVQIDGNRVVVARDEQPGQVSSP